MRRNCIVLTLVVILAVTMHLNPVNGAPQDDSISLTIYGNGLTKVNYVMDSDPMDVQVFTELVGDNIQNLIVRDENGEPLDYQLTYSTVIVDSIGATQLSFTYYTESLVKTEAGLTFVSLDSPTPVSIRLPEGSDFFDMSHIPIQISVLDGVPYLVFEPGDIYVYYLIGLPELNQESLASLSKAEAYITTKQSEGYHLDGAIELVEQARTVFTDREYYTSKALADDALKVAVKTIESAEQVSQRMKTVKIILSSKKNTPLSESYTQGSEVLDLAQAQYDRGEYVKASLTLMDFAKLDFAGNNVTVYSLIPQFIPLIMLLGLCGAVYLSEKKGVFQSTIAIRGVIDE